MTVATDALIDAYVADVTGRLPRRSRSDVAAELRSLLTEELRGRAGDSGRLPDDQMALDLVRAFGHPSVVAARYHPAVVPIIPPAETRGFVWATVIGVALQWAGSLPLALTGQLLPHSTESTRLATWWLSYGLGALWWPGFLVTVMMIAAWLRRTWPAPDKVWQPTRANVPANSNRGRFALALAGAVCGVAVWIGAVWASLTFSNPATRALTFDPPFLATRAPVVLIYWSASIALLVVLFIEGSWRPLTRQLDHALKIACCMLLVWLVLDGRIFVVDEADQSSKAILSVLVVVILAQLAFQIWRGRRRTTSPHFRSGAN